MVRSVKDRVPSARPGAMLPRSLRAFPYTAPTTPKGATVPEEESTLGIDYDSEWARKPFVNGARRVIQESVLRAGISALTSPTVKGLDRLEGLDGPVVFAANHHSHLDIGLLLLSIPSRFRERAVVAAAADYFFDKRIKAMLSALTINAVPIERLKVSRRSSDQLLALLADDWNLLIFPEGGRSPDGWGQDFKPGAAFLASRRGCPIVPVHIDGTDQVLPRGASRPKRAGCTVTFGHPIRASAGEDVRLLGDRLGQAVAELADERHSDWWSARRNAANARTPELTGPDGVSGWRRQWERTQRRAARDVGKERGARAWP
jgi:1-acyl-sn-glycerol-3-phosphate acyltransferase